MQNSNPLVYVAGSSNQGKPKANNTFDLLKNNFGKIFLVLMALIIVYEGYIGWNSLHKKTPSTAKVDKVAALTDGTIVLDSDKTVYSLGETVPVKIRIATGGTPIESVDLVLKYDPNLLEASRSAGLITLGKIFQDFPIYDTDGKGEVVISGITPIGNEGFTGIGELATVNFTAKAIGKTSIKVDFKKDSTTDSNLVKINTTKDILSRVEDLDLNITETATSQNNSPVIGNKCDGFWQYCEFADGKTGKQFCRAGKMVAEECVFDSKITVSCDLCQFSK